MPAKTTLLASRVSAGAAASGSTPRSTGSDSPVRGELSTLSSCESITRASADTRSPSRSRTISPGTSSAASTSCLRPSRSTTARLGRRAAKARVACSARYSWAKLNAALTSTTAMMATPSSGIPAANARTEAAHRSRAKKWVSWAASCTGRPGPRAWGSALGPSRRSRSAASPAVRPPRPVRSAASAASGAASAAASTAPSGAARGAPPRAAAPRSLLMGRG